MSVDKPAEEKINHKIYREILQSSEDNMLSPLSIDTPCLVLDFETYNISNQSSSSTDDWVVTCIGGCVKQKPESKPVSFGIIPKDHWTEKMLFQELANNFTNYLENDLDKIELSDFNRIITFNGEVWDLNFIERNKKDLHYWLTFDDSHTDVRKYLKKRLVEHSILDEGLPEWKYPSLEEGLKAWGEEPDVVHAPQTISGELVRKNTPEISRKIMNGEASHEEKEALKSHAIADCKNTLKLYTLMLKNPKPANPDVLRS